MPGDYRLLPTSADPDTRRAVRDADIERRVAALERSRLGRADVVTCGPIGGNGGSIPGSWSVLPNLTIAYTSVTQTRAEIRTQVRIDANSAAWTFHYTGLYVNPAPTVSRLHQNAVAGGGNTQASLSLGWTHSGGVASIQHVGWDTMVLSAGVTYYFYVMALSSGGIWTAGIENFMAGMFWPQSA